MDHENPTATPIQQLLELMVKLRDPHDGCPWDKEQTFATIAPYTIEEAYEVHDAVQRNDMADLKDELGDLLFQIIFHAQMAADQGHFDFDDVTTAIVDKMIRRHPHIFTDCQAPLAWEALKKNERADNHDKSALAGIAKALPALMVAEKLQKRAGHVGFDWPDAQGPIAKIHEELAEIVQAPSDQNRLEEFGDLLFSVVNLGRKLNIDSETAMRLANDKFERRFRAMENIIGTDEFARMDLAGKEALWLQVKSQIPASDP